ncbi:MAG: ABC transporter substrate-binding protein [Deltaproteobacteria bacterium]|nr:ABC transporter substrate-binding protein [Deltaproteobacteria bacterium]
MKRISTILIGLSLVFFLTVLPVVSLPSTTAAAEPIKVGFLACYTGMSSLENPWMVNAAKLACEEFGWEIAGRPIKLIIEDSGSAPATAVDKARKMVEADKVHVVIGPITSHAASAVASYLKGIGIPFLFVAEGRIEMLRLGGGNVYLPKGTLRGRSYPLGYYAYDKMGARTAVVIHDDFASGEDFADGAMDAFVSRGGKIVQRIRAPMDTMDYGPYLSSMKDADVVLYWMVPHHNVQFVKQYYAYGMKMPLVISGDPTLGSMSMKEIGDNCLGIIAINAYEAGIDTSGSAAWRDRWMKQYGHLSEKEGKHPYQAEGATAYNSVSIALQAIKAAGGNTSKKVLNDTLKKTKFETPWGPVSFTNEGLIIANSYILRIIKEGDFYRYKDIFTYEQVEAREPDDIKGAAKK